MCIYDKIKNDEEIIELYDKISDIEDENKGWAHHDLQHVTNVAELVEKILRCLNYDDEYIEEAKIAAILHDTGCIEGKEGHALRSYKFAKNYLIDNEVKLKNTELVLEAIRIHSDGFDTDNIIALALILSDKLDIKSTRVAKEGYNVKGMKELQFIEDILIDIHNNILEINFICDSKINKHELEEFYFIKKVFKAINSFSGKFELTPLVLFNYEKWDMFYITNLSQE